jgi:heterotetrameric sarcosine oxidase gamma subunit
MRRTLVSARDAHAQESHSRIGITTADLDIVELAALHGGSEALVALAALRGVPLPALGQALVSGGRIALAVRPARWLVLSPPAQSGSTAAGWQAACTGHGVAIDLSSGICALRVSGPSPLIRARLARGCRLDLDSRVFPAGSTAATIIAQVSVILIALEDGMLLLTPSTTARHFREWLGENLT